MTPELCAGIYTAIPGPRGDMTWRRYVVARLRRRCYARICACYACFGSMPRVSCKNTARCHERIARTVNLTIWTGTLIIAMFTSRRGFNHTTLAALEGACTHVGGPWRAPAQHTCPRTLLAAPARIPCCRLALQPACSSSSKSSFVVCVARNSRLAAGSCTASTASCSFARASS